MGIQTAGRERKPSLVVNSAAAGVHQRRGAGESERPEQSLTAVKDTRLQTQEDIISVMPFRAKKTYRWLTNT